MENMLDAALAYARAGIRIFPCAPNSKRPLISQENGGHGVHDATTNVEIITKWWTANPSANIGVGLDSTGLCVVDLDVKGDGFATWNVLCKAHLPTQCAWTPSGGLHLYYKGSLRPTVRHLGPGIDTRGVGSYTLAPPSIVNGKSYRWVEGYDTFAPVPEWLVAAVGKRKVEPKAAVTEELDTPENVGRARDYVERVIKEVGTFGQEDPPDTYTILAKVKDIGVSETGCLALVMEFHGGHELEWLEKTIHNVYRYGQNEPGSAGVEAGSKVFEEQAEKLREASQKAMHERWHPRRPSQIVRLPAITFWDEERMFPRHQAGGVGMMYGQDGHHKTNIVLTKMFDMWERPNPPRVAFASGEGSQGLGVRFKAHCILRGIEPADLDELALFCEVPMVGDDHDMSEFHDLLALEAFQPDILILDTWATALAGMDEDHRAAALMTTTGNLGRLARARKLFGLIIHHTGHETNRARGASGFKANSDVFLRCSAADDSRKDAVWLFCERMKDGAEKHSTYYGIERVGGVPVPVVISKTAYEMLSGKIDAVSVGTIASKLLAVQAYAGIRTKQLVQSLYPIGRDQDPEEWDRAVNKLVPAFERRAEELANVNNIRSKAAEEPLLWIGDTNR